MTIQAEKIEIMKLILETIKSDYFRINKSTFYETRNIEFLGNTF